MKSVVHIQYIHIISSSVLSTGFMKANMPYYCCCIFLADHPPVCRCLMRKTMTSLLSHCTRHIQQHHMPKAAGCFWMRSQPDPHQTRQQPPGASPCLSPGAGLIPLRISDLMDKHLKSECVDKIT